MDWNLILQTLLTGLVIPAIGYALLLLKNYWTSQTNKIENDKLRALVTDASDRAFNLMTDTVQAIEQEVVPTLNQGILDGTKTNADKKALLLQAVQNVKAQLTPEYTEALKSQVNDIDLYLTTLASSIVFNVKHVETAAALPATDGTTPAVDTTTVTEVDATPTVTTPVTNTIETPVVVEPTTDVIADSVINTDTTPTA